MTACTVKVEEKIVEKVVEKTITDAMEQREYGLSFEIDGQQHLLNDSLYFWEKDGQMESTYLKKWVVDNLKGYRGPFVDLQVGRILGMQITNDKRDATGGFSISRRPNGKWGVQLIYENSTSHYYYYNEDIPANSITIEVLKGDLYVTYKGNMPTPQLNSDGTVSMVTISKLFFKSKLINTEGTDFLVGGPTKSLRGMTGVSINQGFDISFMSCPGISGNLVDSFFYGSSSFIPANRMNSAINYIYVNGEKVTGSWDPTGTTFSYSPATPYPANSKVKVIIPQEMANIKGSKLAMPYAFSFTTAGQNLGTPHFYNNTHSGGYNNVSLHWRQYDSENIKGFKIYRSDNKLGPFTLLDTRPALPEELGQGSFHYADKTVVAGKTYYYQLQALSSTVEGEKSKTVEGQSLDISEAQLNNELKATYITADVYTKCYKYSVTKGKSYRFNLKDQTNSTFTALGKVRISYKDAAGEDSYLNSPTGPEWTNKSDTFTAPANEIFILVIIDSYTGISWDKKELSFQLVEETP